MNLRFTCLLSVLLGSLSASLLHADETPTKPAADRFQTPLIRAWYPSTFADDQRQFLRQIQHELKETEPESQPAENSESQPPHSESTAREGLLVYYDPHRSAPIESTSGDHNKWFVQTRHVNFPGHPWLKPVRFMRVESREAFEKEVRRRTVESEHHSLGHLEETKAGFIFKPIPVQSSAILDPLPGVLDPYLSNASRFWTYRDGYMFFGDFEEIFTIDFPANRQLQPTGTGADRDVFVRLDLDAILPKQKRLLWKIVRQHAERNLQQYDEEDAAEYALRKSLGELQLNLIEVITQDLERIQLGIDFASNDQPARANLELVARPRQNLEQTFGKSGRGSPPLAAFIDEPAAMTFATSWGIPEQMVEPIENFLRVFNARLTAQQGWNVDALIASEELTHDLLETIRESNHVVLKLQQTQHGFILFGGLRLLAADHISKNLEVILNGLTGNQAWGVQRSRDSSGRNWFSFRPADFSKSIATDGCDHLPAELHFTVIDSVLWFSVGRQDAIETLAGALDRVGKTQEQSRSIPLALFEVSLDRLFPEKEREDTNGFDRLPLAAMEKLDSLIPRKTSPHNRIVFNSVNTLDLEVAETSRFVTVHKSDNINQTGKAQAETLKFDNSTTSDTDEVPLKLLIKNAASKDLAEGELSNLIVSLRGDAVSDPQKLKKFLKEDQSRIRLQLDADKKRVRLRATFGLGVIKHVLSRRLQNSNGFGDRLWLDVTTFDVDAKEP